ncbi:hypothetical protein R69608_05082 [Paraburkholderia nemoris]|nr:hypothetical protein R69608_05082 [Paraburkholderia nemoris]
MQIIDWIWKNKEWLFSGILATISFAVWGWFRSQRQSRPLAIGYEIFGPFSHPLPVDILKEDIIAQSQTPAELVILALRLDNYSNESCRNLRVLYSAECEYPAQLEFKRRDTEVRYNIDHKNKEILIDEIPPNETVSVAFFNPYKGFSIEHVLIGDAKVTDSMRKHAEAKRYPMLYWSGKIATAAMLITVVTAFWAGHELWKSSKDREIISSATGNLGGCVPTVIHDSDENQDDLNHRFLALNYPYDRMVLAMNKVSSLEELDKKKTVIFCESSKE